jgi:predicted enzyme related to lactoylglutathione lyase
MTRISSVNLRVADLDRSAAFYRDLVGLPLDESHAHPPEDLRHCEVMFGSFEELYCFFVLFEAAPGEETVRADVGFHVDDLDAAHGRMVAGGAKVVAPPREVPWGREAAYLDPDGNTVTLGG